MTPSGQVPSRTIEELRTEFAANGLHGWLWGWLLFILSAYVWARFAGRYRPALYSPSGQWDNEGVRDLVNDFVTERGIKKGLIARALLLTDSSRTCIGYLEKAFHHFVISEGGQSIERNIYHRLCEVLAEDPELRRLAGAGSSAAYGDVRWSDEPPTLADETVLKAAERYIPEHVATVHYRSESRRSPVLAKEALRTIARALILGTGRLMTASQILHVLTHRFNLQEGPGTPVADGEETLCKLPSAQMDPLDSMIAEETAEQLLGNMTERQRRVFFFWTQQDPPLTAREIAESTGLGKSTVNNEQRAIVSLAEALKLTSRAEQDQVISICARILREQGS